MTPHDVYLIAAAVVTMAAGLLIGRYGMPSLSPRQLAYADEDELIDELHKRGYYALPIGGPDDPPEEDDDEDYGPWCQCGDDTRAGLHGTSRCDLARPLEQIRSEALRALAITTAVDTAALDRIAGALEQSLLDDLPAADEEWAETLHRWNTLDSGPAPDPPAAMEVSGTGHRAPAGPDYSALSDAEFFAMTHGTLEAVRALAAAPWLPLPPWRPHGLGQISGGLLGRPV